MFKRIYVFLLSKVFQKLLKECGKKFRCEIPIKMSWDKIIVGDNVYIGTFARIESITESAQLLIGSDVSIEQGGHIVFSGDLEIVMVP